MRRTINSCLNQRTVLIIGILIALMTIVTSVQAASNNARFITQNVPTRMETGETRSVSITMENNGSTTWTRAGGYKLGTQNPQDNKLWTGGTRIYLSSSDVIKPGQRKTFTFNITAPSTPNTYDFQWRMVQEGVEWFGDFTTNVRIKVVAPASVNNARFITQNVPTRMETGETRSVSITMENNGSTTWTRAGGYKLGTQNPQDNKLWTGGTRIYLSSSDVIKPGQRKTFTFNITAPSTPNTYDFQWRMVQEGVEWFGDFTTNIKIQVVGGGGNCPAANPNDNKPDDAALQACLNRGGTVELLPGSPGYIIATGLKITQDDTILTSSARPTRARLRAAPGLFAPMLEAQSRRGFQISYIEFDGNRPSRTRINNCSGYRSFGTNVIIGNSRNFAFNNNRSTRAMCGSALQVNGNIFEIARNVIDNNGHGREAKDAPEPWSDGITLGKCVNGNVHHNQITDATDIAIVSGGGRNCRIENNTIKQINRHAFAGIALHYFSVEGKGDHTGAVVRNNTLSANTHRLSFGLSIGMHPWTTTVTTQGGTVSGNTVSGAMVNLAVDGVNSVTIGANNLSSPGGTPVCGGSPTNYTVAHATNSSLAPGWISRSYDRCIP